MTTTELTELSAAVAAALETQITRNFQIIPTLTLDQAAKAIGVSNETMRKLCKEKKIPHIKMDREYRIKPADINNYLDSLYIAKEA
jgi:excisionase family DNA binding protein